MIQTVEQGLHAILEGFPPGAHLHFGEDYWRIISGIVSFGTRKFSVRELANAVNEDKVWRHKPIENQRFEEVLKSLEETGLAKRDSKGKYQVSRQASMALGEFFSLVWRPRGGKTGFMNFLFQSKQRTIQWYCIYKKVHINPADASRLTELGTDECRMYLERLVRHHQLVRMGVEKYKVFEEEKIFRELLSGYEQYRYTKPTIKEFILLIMQYHEKISGKEIHKQLERAFEIICDPTTVYKHLKNLLKKEVIKKTGETKIRGAHEEYYSLNYENIEAYTRELLDGIREVFTKIGIRTAPKFFEIAAKQKPHVLRIFFEQLRAITVQGLNDESSCALWASLRNNLVAEGLCRMVSELSSTESKVEIKKQLTRLVRQHNVSPALILMLYMKSPQKMKAREI